MGNYYSFFHGKPLEYSLTDAPTVTIKLRASVEILHLILLPFSLIVQELVTEYPGPGEPTLEIADTTVQTFSKEREKKKSSSQRRSTMTT